VPLRDVATMPERLSASAAVPRFRMRLFTALAAVSVALAVIGLYGILAYQVSQRRKETAVRRALGATSLGILARVIGSALGLTVTGTVIGFAVAYGLTRSLSAFLFGVAPDDLSAFALAAAVLLSAATLSSIMPAVRAVTENPLTVLRED
jgi:putative ABC transport system permease protein